jgi:hypothetical protein
MMVVHQEGLEPAAKDRQAINDGLEQSMHGMTDKTLKILLHDASSVGQDYTLYNI